MSLTCMRKCHVNGCKYNTHHVDSDIEQIKKHLRTHDYKELQATVFELGLIKFPHERRSPKWFVDELAKLSKVDEVY